MKGRNVDKDKVDVWDKIIKAGDDDCWLWKEDTLNIPPSFRSFSARKIVWYSLYNEWPKEQLETSCWKPNCFNPKHLKTKTQNQINLFNSYLTKSDDCLIWNGEINNTRGIKTAKFTTYGHKYSSVKFAWKIKNGEFPESRLYRTCSSELCVNIEHYTKSQDDTRSFWRQVVIPETKDECWGWKGCLEHGEGVGYCVLKGKQYRANRASYILHFGEIPEEKIISNSCKNKTCVNPKHLIITNHSELSKDFIDAKLDKYYNRVKETKMHFAETLYNSMVSLMKMDFKCILKFRRSFVKEKNGCWVLKNKTNRKNCFFSDRYNKVSHITLAYRIYKGVINDKTKTFNICKNTKCINPDHNLFHPEYNKIKFKSLCKINEDNKCWEWIGSYKEQYGVYFCFGKKMHAHRASYLFHKGKIDNGLLVRHICNNKKCVNPEHLELGTASDNCKDWIQAVKDGNNDKWENKMRYIDGKAINDLASIGWDKDKLAELYGYSKKVIEDCLTRFKTIDSNVSIKEQE